MTAPIRTTITVIPGHTRGTFQVLVEDSHPEKIFTFPDGEYPDHARCYPLPTVYRSSRTAERAGRCLALRMRATFRLPPEHA